MSERDLHYMVFPRLLAMAERAWHKADWEHDATGGPAAANDTRLDDDWTRFSHVLGHRELSRLDDKRIFYRVPPPGAR